MNKKLSLMLAAFVAAGYSLTAEAGVVKIANPVDGRSYVIGEAGLTTVTSNSADQLYNSTNVPAFTDRSSSNAKAEISADYLWKFVGDIESTFSLTNGSNGYLEYYSSAARYNTVASDNTVWVYANNKIQSANDANSAKPAIKQNITSVEFDTEANGVELSFYAVTSIVNDGNNGGVNLTNQEVKIGDKYLVIRPSDGASAVPVLVDGVEYQNIAKVAPKNVVWQVGTQGRLTSPSDQVTNKQVKADGTGGILTFSLVTVGSGTQFEENKAEGLFGWTDASGHFNQIKKDGSVKDLTTNTFTEQEREDTFASISYSESDYMPGAPVLTDYDFIGGSVTGASNFLIGFNDGANDKFINWTTQTAYTNVAGNTEAPDMNEAYIWTPQRNSDGTYSFVAKIGDETKIMNLSGETDFNIEGSTLGFRLYVTDGVGTKYYVVWNSSTLEVQSTSNVTNAVIFGAYLAASVPYTAHDLIEYQGTSFMLDLADHKDGKDMNQNPFADNALVPMIPVDAYGRTWDNPSAGDFVGFRAAENGETSYLLNIAGTESYIVVDKQQKWSTDELSAYILVGGYKFITFEEDNLLKYLNNDGKQSERQFLYKFSINHIPGAQNIENGNIANIIVTDMDGTVTYYLVSYNSNKNYYLTVNADKQNLVQAKFGSKYAITVASTENNPFNDRYVTIKFSNHKSIKAQSLYGSSVPLNGKVLGMSENGAYAAPQSTDKVRLDAPEGQWIVLATTTAAADDDVAANGKVDNNAGVKGTDTRFTFVNRESGVSFTVNRMYWIEGDKYAVESNNPFAHAQRDTMIIENANVTKDAYNNSIMEDGAYANYKAADILDQEYNLIVKSTQSDYYVSENHAGQHLLGITEAAEDAVNWQIIPMTAARILDKDGYLEMPTDTVYNIKHTQYWSNGALYQTTDTLAMISYVLKNTANGEYITYENPQTHDVLSMICDPKSENLLLNPQNADEYFAEIAKGRKYATNDYRFIIKLKPEGKTNLIGVKSTGYESLEYRTIDLDSKLYGATTQKNGAIEVENAYNRVNSNDLFEVAKIDAPEYKLVDRGDTVRIFRAEDEYSVMYENGQFLNLGNIATVEDMAPALYVDTAFVNRTDEYGKNNRYQYLLVVNPKYVPAEPCDIPGHPELHPDTTYGRFLINMIDSAVWANANGAIHNNKFINDTEADETYVKVGFHWGYRTGDALYLTEDNTYSKVEKKIALDSRDFNIAKFAFRYTNAASNDPNGSFKIQTRYIDYNDAIKGEGEIYESNDGFLRTVNGVVVVTEGYARGEEFNLTAETSDPTANETITAEGAVSVVATDGAVTIKGAEGKNVVIATILGKVVANETINSDNETIAVPAGIAVVSVDGESFKVVVK